MHRVPDSVTWAVGVVLEDSEVSQVFCNGACGSSSTTASDQRAPTSRRRIVQLTQKWPERNLAVTPLKSTCRTTVAPTRLKIHSYWIGYCTASMSKLTSGSGHRDLQRLGQQSLTMTVRRLDHRMPEWPPSTQVSQLRDRSGKVKWFWSRATRRRAEALPQEAPLKSAPAAAGTGMPPVRHRMPVAAMWAVGEVLADSEAFLKYSRPSQRRSTTCMWVFLHHRTSDQRAPM